VLLEQAGGDVALLLTRRTGRLRTDPGQIAFPGGRLEPDETPEQAALREGWEEIRLDKTSVELLGEGPALFEPRSRFWVVPVFAWWHSPHPLTPNPEEVSEILRVPLEELVRESRLRRIPAPDGAGVWAWQLDSGLLWGVAGAIAGLALELVRPDWSAGRSPSDLPDDREVQPWAARLATEGAS
jgi:8-oxo-dGTP pyrophosphatase MutT (NUDIX family)